MSAPLAPETAHHEPPRPRPRPEPEPLHEDPRADLVARTRRLLAATTHPVDPEDPAAPGGGWLIRSGGFWCAAEPRDAALPVQGWKLHLSATPVSVGDLLDRAVPLLARHRTAFRFAPTTGAVRWLTSRDCARSQAGKVVTAYPQDDAVFAALAAELDAATTGLAGPRILSDAPYRPGSVVHHRYGGFTGSGALDDDGVYRYHLTTPDGETVEDRRDVACTTPSWVTCPVHGSEPDGDTGPGAGAAVLLGGRYLVRAAVRHSAKGGVYLATDRSPADEAGEADAPVEVVVKHARAHAETDLTGTDARDLLRHEAATLDHLAGVAPVPRRLELFEQDGDLFLAEERLPGVPLRTWVRQRSGRRPGVPLPDALRVARALLDAVTGVHDAGFALRDLSPTNVLVADGAPDGAPDGTPDGAPDGTSVHLVDLELAGATGTPVRRTGTSGYQAPELRTGDDYAPLTHAEDRYSLGALLFLLATGDDPLLPRDDEPARPAGGRLAAWLDALAPDSGTARTLAPLVLGLLADDPDERWSLPAAGAWLTAAAAGDGTTTNGRSPDAPGAAAPTGVPVTVPSSDRLLTDGLVHLLRTRADGSGTSGQADRLWPTGAAGELTDPGAVRHGAAGVLATLTAALPHGHDLLPETAAGTGLAAAVHATAAWLARQEAPRGSEHPLPGLYLGRAGVAWTLADAAVALDDAALLDRAVEQALRLPAAFPNPDVVHGTAGAGLACLHLAMVTGDDRLLDRALAYADAVADAVDVDEDGGGEGDASDGDVAGGSGPRWTIPAWFRSRLAGTAHHGFAHGTAGIGCFLLAAGRAGGRDDLVDLAVLAGDGLVRAADVDAGGAAWWPPGPGGRDRRERDPHWAGGSSGVGTFLLRLFSVTGRPVFGDLAAAAAVAVHRSRWQSSPGTGRGLAGDGQFLLDAADLTSDPTYLAWAADLARAAAVRTCRRDGRLLVSGTSSGAVPADHDAGLAGVLAFLLRLRYGGPRPFMTDEALGRPAPRTRALVGARR